MFDRALYKGELLLRDVVKQAEAVDIRRDQVGAVKSTHLTSLPEDAIHVTTGGAVEDGFQAVAFMEGREDD